MDRKKILVKNISLGIIYKVINMIVVFTNIPLLLNYLDKEFYGIWVTIFSIVNIVFFVDAGIGNGLKTKLAEALSNKNFKLAKTYISTAYFSIAIISFILFFTGLFIILNINLQELFNTVSISNKMLKIVLITTLLLITISFVLNLYKSIYYANQQASKVELAMLLYQILILSCVAVLLQYYTKNLFLVALVYGVSNLLIGFFFTINFFYKNQKIKPSFNFFSKSKVKDLMGLSLVFFVIQLCMIVIFTTDNLIITNLLGPSEVTSYDIVYKLFQIIITFSIIMQDPFWALYSDAYQKKDFKWIKITIIRLNRLFFGLILIVVVLIFTAKPFIFFWTQKDLAISKNLLILMGVFVLIRTYGIIYMNFLNAIGEVKKQMYLYIFGAVINIPLSIYFVKYLNMGSSGVILGTIISILALSIMLPIQTHKILKEKQISI